MRSASKAARSACGPWLLTVQAIVLARSMHSASSQEPFSYASRSAISRASSATCWVTEGCRALTASSAASISAALPLLPANSMPTRTATLRSCCQFLVAMVDVCTRFPIRTSIQGGSPSNPAQCTTVITGEPFRRLDWPAHSSVSPARSHSCTYCRLHSVAVTETLFGLFIATGSCVLRVARAICAHYYCSTPSDCCQVFRHNEVRRSRSVLRYVL